MQSVDPSRVEHRLPHSGDPLLLVPERGDVQSTPLSELVLIDEFYCCDDKL